MLKTEEFETFACVFNQTPSPCGYSLLSRESIIIPPLEEEVDSKNFVLKTEEFSSHRMFFGSTIDFRTPSELFHKKSSRPSSRGTVFLVCFKDLSERYKS